MNQLPIFVTLRGRNVLLVGNGEAADAKRRLIERAGGICVSDWEAGTALAFVAIADGNEALAVAERLKAKGLLVNVVDQPALCDFTTPAIIDRDPVLIAIGTGGASAGLAKALRQRLEMVLPQNLGRLATQLQSARDAIRAKWPNNAARRKAVDDALVEAGMLDPLGEANDEAVAQWLGGEPYAPADNLITIRLHSPDPDEISLKQARLLGQADHIFHDVVMPDAILNRARADAVRHIGSPSPPLPGGLVLHLQLQSGQSDGKGCA